MIPRKITGWVLIVIGILIITWGLYSTYNIFTGKKAAPEVFKMSQDSSDTSDKGISLKGIEQEMEKMVGEQISKIVPRDDIYKLLNLISWSIFATILFFGGGKIATVGVGMLKNQ